MDGLSKPLLSARNWLKSESISASQVRCLTKDEESLSEYTADGVPQKIAQLKT